jgi:hypothetical protein
LHGTPIVQSDNKHNRHFVSWRHAPCSTFLGAIPETLVAWFQLFHESQMSPIALCMLALTVSTGAFAKPRDPSAVFTAINDAISVRDYYKANSLLGTLTNDLLAAGVPPLTGTTAQRVTDAGRRNRDIAVLVQRAQVAWTQATGAEQPWDEVMIRLSEASSSAVVLDTALPQALRYDQAHARYDAVPSIILLHQLILRAFEAGEYGVASKYIAEERKQIPHAYSGASGPILNRLETLAGILALKDGNLADAIQALKRSGDALKQHTERRLQRPPGMLLAQQLFKVGGVAAVVDYLDVCAQFEYPGGEEYTDEGPNPSSAAHLKAAILAGESPQFPATLVID